MAARIGIVIFPGTNCEHDVAVALGGLGADPVYLWHHDDDLKGVDAVVIPGGFAHGDYVRPGAIARFSPVMGSISGFAAAGGPVVGICNGFQVLCEAGLLPGALQRNAGRTFLCEPVGLEVAATSSVLTCAAALGQRLTIPINHFWGSYVCEQATLDQLESDDRIVLRYTDNPNGSMGDVAGVANEAGNVVGLMPHPERASAAILGSTDGLVLFEGLLASVRVAA
jgi:phosphoribosylformylglycinamidine synthase subunit PurQ / glutaminase